MSNPIQIPQAFTVSLGKTDRVFHGGSEFTNEILEHLAQHGLKQKLGDAYNTFKGTEAEKLAAAQKVFDALRSGTIRAPRATGDQVKRRAIEIVSAKLTQAAKAKGIETDAKAIRADAIKRVESDPKWLALAKAQIEMEGDLEV